MRRTTTARVLVPVMLGAWGMAAGALGCAYGITETEGEVEQGLGQPCDCACDTSTASTTSSSSTPTGAGGSGAAPDGGVGGTGGEDGGTGGASACDNRGDCYECANCSLSYDCAYEADACMNSVECSDFLDCIYDCYDDACMNACASQYPSGVNLYIQMTDCAFCDACPVDCQYENQGMCT